MFNFAYLKYLFNSKKYLLLFIVLLAVLIIVGIDNRAEALTTLCVLMIVLTYFLPCDIFGYLHDKRAIDAYFSLPLSRKQLLNTALLFIVIIIVSLFGLSYITIELVKGSFGINSLVNALVFILAYICLTFFNTLLYQLGNTVLDGVVMIGAYTILPLAIYLLLGVFFDSFVYGFQGVDLDFETYFSPIYMTIYLLINVLEFKESLRIDYLIAITTILFISYFALNFTFNTRKVERAGSLSKAKFAYPLVINLYALICLLVLACGYDYLYVSLFAYLKEYALALIVIFALYISAYFVYQRSFTISYKYSFIFVLLLVVAFGFAGIARANDGFGLAYKYNQENINYCTIYIYNPSQELRSEFSDNDDYLSINIILGVDSDRELSSSIKELINNKRQEAIALHFAGEEVAGEQITIYNNYQQKAHGLCTYDDSYTYIKNVDFSCEDLLEIAKSENCEVYIEDGQSGYKLEP